MSKVKLSWNYEQSGQLLKNEEMQGVLKDIADSIASSADGEYDVSTRVGKTRANASIAISDPDTYQKNLKENTLLKAVSSYG